MLTACELNFLVCVFAPQLHHVHFIFKQLPMYSSISPSYHFIALRIRFSSDSLDSHTYNSHAALYTFLITHIFESILTECRHYTHSLRKMMIYTEKNYVRLIIIIIMCMPICFPSLLFVARSDECVVNDCLIYYSRRLRFFFFGLWCSI